MGLFTGKKGMVFGIANDKSIAWAITQKLADEGAEMGFTHLPESNPERPKNEKKLRKLVDPRLFEGHGYVSLSMYVENGRECVRSHDRHGVRSAYVFHPRVRRVGLSMDRAGASALGNNGKPCGGGGPPA